MAKHMLRVEKGWILSQIGAFFPFPQLAFILTNEQV